VEIFISVIAGYLYATWLEWVLHKYVLHKLGKVSIGAITTKPAARTIIKTKPTTNSFQQSYPARY